MFVKGVDHRDEVVVGDEVGDTGTSRQQRLKTARESGTRGSRQALAKESAQMQLARDWGGPELRELYEQRWEEVVKAELKRRDKTEADLSNDRKSVQWERDLAVRLRTKTSATNPWIAQRFNTGHPSYISKWLKETPKF